MAFEYVRRAAEKDCVQAVQQLGVRGCCTVWGVSEI